MSGACSCGQVTYSVSEPLLGAMYCHCKRCQRRTGTAFSVSALTQPGSFEITTGEELVREYDPGAGGWIKAFCSNCGGHLYTSNPESIRMLDPKGTRGVHQAGRRGWDGRVCAARNVLQVDGFRPQSVRAASAPRVESVGVDVPETTDPDGRTVVFDAGSHVHLAKRRPWLLDYIDVILETVARPDFRADDPLPGRERFYRQHLDKQRWLRVVVDFNDSPAWVVTAAIQHNDPTRADRLT